MGEALQRNKSPRGSGLPNNITYPNTDTMNKLITINKKQSILFFLLDFYFFIFYL